MYLKEISTAVFDGIISIPTDLFHGVIRTYEDVGGKGKKVRLENLEEDKRALKIIENAIKYARSDTGPIAQIVKIILEEFYKDIPDSIIGEVAKKLGVGAVYMGSRTTTQAIIVKIVSTKLTNQIAIKIVSKNFTRGIVGFSLGALVIQGVIEKASNSAKELKRTHPEIYRKLRERDLDMAFFLVEKPFSKLLKLMSLKKTNIDRYNEQVKELKNEIILD
ncbi:hypothetical protein MSP8887_04042 [Marinomonas spartinae]|uniref:hypothetical protein n=1 Tax=Marinomonas spartinae TaxID=1792290 RepID=UPI000808B1F7|nr:hypothetical protein [Marinomonas spartinae]SBS39862.1 hypothetical protein MSP8887_04042 [Marinomonas spartinae]